MDILVRILEGHPMHLWTHAEAVHSCTVCGKDPIQSGYRCHVCNTNTCDACTDRAGRIFVQKKIRDDIQAFVEYFVDHAVESEVARDTLESHDRDAIENPYPTILDLMSKRVLYARLKQVAAAQVILYKIIKEIERLRAQISEHAWLSAPARRERERTGNFVQAEIDRLNAWIDIREIARSPPERAKAFVCCPLGHCASPYLGCPNTYLNRNKIAEKRRLLSIKELAEDEEDTDSDSDWSNPEEENEIENSEDGSAEVDNDNRGLLALHEADEIDTMTSSYVDCSENDTRDSSVNLKPAERVNLINPPPCRVCYRKSSAGYHCEYCEYDLCGTCGEIYCTVGHRMAIWNAGYDPNSATAEYNDDIGSIKDDNSSLLSENRSVSNFNLLEHVKNITDNNEARTGRLLLVDRVSGLHDQGSVGSSTMLSSSHKGRSVHTEVSCAICEKPDITSGYRCAECAESNPSKAYICDLCTAAEGRKKLRQRWDEELDDIIAFMKHEKNFSDIARHFSWQNKAVIVSIRLLVEHVRMMREEQRKVRLQVKSKSGIDELKRMKAELTVHESLCVVARIEASLEPDYVFETKKDLKMELRRQRDLQLMSNRLKSIEQRLEHKFACPLGHGCVPIPGNAHLPFLTAEAAAFRRKMYGRTRLDAGDQDNKTSGDDNAIKLGEPTEAGMNPGNYSGVAPVDVDAFAADPLTLNCAVCQCSDLHGGRFCLYCDYAVCSTCSVVYCRRGHPCKIWTMPEAQSMRCDVCQATITAGYRCMECNVDICDMCTKRETRITMQLFPMREALKILSYFDLVKDQSDIARTYVGRYGSGSSKAVQEKEMSKSLTLSDASVSEKSSPVSKPEAPLFSRFSSVKDTLNSTFASDTKSVAESKDLSENVDSRSSSPFKASAASSAKHLSPARTSVVPDSKYNSRPTTSYMQTGGSPGHSRPMTAMSLDLGGEYLKGDHNYVFEDSEVWHRDAGPLEVGGSMSHTCCVLLELRAAKALVDEEIGLKKLRVTQAAGVRANARSRQQQIVKAWGNDL
jgi:hypothetical protein